MTDPGKLPTSGYVFERVYSNNLLLRVTPPKENAPTEGPLLFSWDWRLLGDGPAFEVSIHVGVDPSDKRLEEVRVSIIGRFRPEGERQEVPLASFARFHAPAILMPFARETISNLTGRGFYTSLVLPPLNVQHLMERQDASATTGAKQLANVSVPAAR